MTSLPSDTMWRIASLNTCAFTGSRPENGSSSTMMSGSARKACAIWIFCWLPFERVSRRLFA